MSDTASNFFQLIQAFNNKLRLRNFVNLWMVEFRVQNLYSVTCGIFQLYFYNNLLKPNQNSKIQGNARLNPILYIFYLNKQTDCGLFAHYKLKEMKQFCFYRRFNTKLGVCCMQKL